MTDKAIRTIAARDPILSDSPGLVAIWLTCVALLVVVMIAVGGATRLTDSGLSITEWKPILGVIPPVTEDAWNRAFEKYQAIPEYREVNSGMSLSEFKFIYWWEWSHRMLGRVIGITYIVPFLVFLFLGKIAPGMRARLWGLFALGGLQGVIGWYMVQSGLTDRIDVSPYRLAMHLSLAFFILALLVWSIAELRSDDNLSGTSTYPTGTRVLAVTFTVLLFGQVILGAFVAGTKAGLVYTTWPFMEGKLIPEGLWESKPWFVSAFEDHLTIQFNHRMTAYALAFLAIIQFVRLAGHTCRVARITASAVAAGTLCQIGLGIWTLLAADGTIPIGLGVAHQTLAAVLLVGSVWHLHVVTRRSGVTSAPT